MPAAEPPAGPAAAAVGAGSTLTRLPGATDDDADDAVVLRLGLAATVLVGRGQPDRPVRSHRGGAQPAVRLGHGRGGFAEGAAGRGGLHQPQPLPLKACRHEKAVYHGRPGARRLVGGPLHDRVNEARIVPDALDRRPSVVLARLDRVVLVPGVLTELGGEHPAVLRPAE